MRKSRVVLQTVVLALLLQGGARAQGPDRGPAGELARLLFPSEVYAALTDQLSAQVLEQVRRGHGRLTTDGAGRIRKVVQELLPHADVLDWYAEAYQGRFTAEELQQLLSFYRTPLGRKAAQLQPDLSREVSRRFAPVLKERLPAALKKAALMP